jgi:hypothetical protein
MGKLRVVSGRTEPGVGWQQQTEGGKKVGIWIQVDTTSAGFTSQPTYVTSLGGNSEHWNTTGGSSVYPPDDALGKDLRRGFRVFIRWDGGNPLEPKKAQDRKWCINWIGME